VASPALIIFFMAGVLYLVATPIGNLEDITLRALSTLKVVDLIACEDTRRTRRLLVHYEISKPLISFHEHNERQRTRELIKKLEAGANIALVSDAGTPLVSDPGYRLVCEATRRAIRVVPIPGPSALIAALSASGLPTNQFTFVGFLPSRPAARRARLEELAPLKTTLIFYEAPHRIREVLEDARSVLGDRQCVIARELTKVHEEFVRGSLSEVAEKITNERGEFVLVIGPPSQDQAEARAEGSEAGAHSLLLKEAKAETAGSILEEVEELMRARMIDQKSALKLVARSRGISRKEAYKLLVREKASGQ
jgi:16S rRNA (cytidine1402-2'-O)-methyltransferase